MRHHTGRQTYDGFTDQLGSSQSHRPGTLTSLLLSLTMNWFLQKTTEALFEGLLLSTLSTMAGH